MFNSYDTVFKIKPYLCIAKKSYSLEKKLGLILKK